MQAGKISPKHAYLIIAHNKFKQLAVLLSLLDDPRNDIFLHIDRKSPYNNQIRQELSKYIKYSRVTEINRSHIMWGGSNLVKCELDLLSEAAKGHYAYYYKSYFTKFHLIHPFAIFEQNE